MLNFFVSAENAERYVRTHPDVEGLPISIPDAAAVGGAIFGDVLGVSLDVRKRAASAGSGE